MMKLRIELADGDARKFYEALEPEIASVPYKKTRSRITVEDGRLVITVEGDDLSALRGTFNSYLNWLRIVDESFSL